MHVQNKPVYKRKLQGLNVGILHQFCHHYILVGVFKLGLKCLDYVTEIVSNHSNFGHALISGLCVVFSYRVQFQQLLKVSSKISF